MTRRVRVLLIAESCNPEWTSVPLVGYNLYKALSQVADVTLATQIRNRDALLRAGAPQETTFFIDSEALAAPCYQLGRILTLGRGMGWTTKQALGWLPYLYFERLLFKRVRSEIEGGAFDLIHRVTPLTPTYPSPIASWTKLPFVLGPINGGLPWPKGTTKVRWAEMEWLSYVRGAYKFLPYVRRTYRNAARIFAASKYTLSSLPRAAQAHATYLPENGIDPQRFHAVDRTQPSRITPFQVLFVGRLVPYKGADIVIEAFASSPRLRDARLVIAGDGPQKQRLIALAAESKVSARVDLKGNVPHAQIPELFRASSVFAFPSLREFGGAVAMEAMSCGCPCIVLDYGGPAELVVDGTGMRLPMTDREGLVRSLREALEYLLDHPGELDAMSVKGAAHAANHYTWTAKAEQIAREYTTILGRTT